MNGGVERAGAGGSGEVEVKSKPVGQWALKPETELSPAVMRIGSGGGTDAGDSGGKT